MYHCIAVQDLLDALNIWHCASVELPLKDRELLEDKALSGLVFLRDILHPDGEIPFFNDAACGIAPPPKTLLEYGANVLTASIEEPLSGSQIIDRGKSGYFGYRAGDDFLLADCGPIGPDYQPGHGHCDLLSFELSVAGRRVIVNSGTYGYEADELRRLLRSTAAHNTVMVEGVEQSEIWASFRVGRRAKPMSCSVEQQRPNIFFIKGEHDGYTYLPQAVVHAREIAIDVEEASWTIRDYISGYGRITATAYLHIHPDFRIDITDETSLMIMGNQKGLRLLIEITGAFGLDVVEGVYCPRFGEKYDSHTIQISVDDELPTELIVRIQRMRDA